VVKTRWLVALLFLIYSCKKKDTESPFLRISQPLAGAAFVASDLIFISGTAGDNKGLSGVSAQVVTADGSRIVSAEYKSLSGTESSFTFSVPAGDRYIFGGSYKVIFRVEDMSGNSDFISVPIEIAPYPQYFLGLALLTGSGNNPASVMLLDSMLNQTTTFSTDVIPASGLWLDNSNGLLYCCGSQNGKLQIYDTGILPGTLIAQDIVTSGSGEKSFKDVHGYRGTCVAGLDIFPFGRFYSGSGIPSGQVSDLPQGVSKVFMGSGISCFAMNGFSEYEGKLTIYDKFAQMVYNTKIFNVKITGMQNLSGNEIVVAGNDINNSAQVYVMDKYGSAVLKTLTLNNEEIYDISCFQNKVWMACSSGIQVWDIFQANSENKYSVLANEIELDTLRNCLYGIQDSTLIKIDLNTGTIENKQFPFNLKKIAVHYSK